MASNEPLSLRAAHIVTSFFRFPSYPVTHIGEANSTGQLFLQQAETVRLISPTTGDGGWKPLSVTDVEGGEVVLVREVGRGTHVGRPIDAVVAEF